MRTPNIKNAILASTSFATIVFGSAVHAQAGQPVTQSAPIASDEAQQKDVSDQGGLTEIIVTAQRRAENQQDVPIAITTITAETLTGTGITTTDQLTAVTPGLTFSRQLKGAVPYIRGVGTQSIAAGVESPVATYIDGVYYMSSVGNVFSLNNVARIEVLKGPQGTLFGRNATGGLINIITRDPTVEPHLEASISYGNFNTVEGAFYATAGSGNFAADIAVQYQDQGEGFGRYLATGNDAYYQRSVGVRGKLLWDVSPDDKFTVSWDWSRDKSDAGATRDAYPGSVLILGFRPAGGYNIQSNFETFVNTEYYGASLKYEHQLPWGSISFVNAYRNLSSQTNIDLDNTPAPFLVALVTESNTTYQSELLLNGSLPRFDFTTGLFYFSATSALAPLGIRSVALAAQNYDDFPTQETKSYAAFAQGTYALTDTTKFTAGLRFTSDERTFSAKRIAVAPNPAGAGAVLVTRVGDKVDYPKLTWRFALDQELASDVLAYISYDRGFKSGTFNTAQIIQPPVNPETLDSYSVGLKSELFDRTLRLNVSLFHYDYSNIQLARLENGTLFLLNAAKGRVNGADLEVLFAPRIATGNLQITGAFSYLSTKYTSFPGGPLTLPSPAVCTPVPRTTGPATGGDTTCSVDLAGRKLIRSPEYTFNLGLQYSLPVGDAELTFAANYFRSDQFFWEPDNRLIQPAYDLVNGSVALAFGRENMFTVRAFIRNLTDSRYYTYVTSGNLGDTQSLAPPRTYGVGFGVKF